ncbi:GNAT family N-acetyltransferase [Natronorubrum thiooxidans]|uniref:Phosphinothricin acetyltransferase n=1 Tax=Natronorubrum thiooxidans TaxID=308853 RepID=A0A1N7GR89_9EURY|nr:GNAT family N-acetyltransferase [Natronorubrum thiooxidans]SIS15107.1 phosphinothricin acetyltransferase [Natronorubrum thiooxidans]
MDAAPQIRLATPEDAAAVRDIYAPFCESTAVTFEETAPTAAELAARIDSTLERYPWLVCVRDSAVVGYAYAGPLRKRRAYQWVVELSVYVADDARRSGVGRALYESLFAILERQGYCDAYAVTTLPNPATVRFHEQLGFECVADFPAMGYTQDAWHDVAWWRRSIAEKTSDPEPPTPLPVARDASDWDGLVQAGVDALEIS